MSDLGRVRSIDRRLTASDGRSWLVRGRVLKVVSLGDGRSQVSLGRGINRKVHQLVMTTFVGPCPEGMEICHNNGDPSDNRLANLRYDTRSGNTLDRVAHGTHHNANKTHCPHGHEYTPANTYVGPSGSRFCRRCNTKAGRARATEAQSAAIYKE